MIELKVFKNDGGKFREVKVRRRSGSLCPCPKVPSVFTCPNLPGAMGRAGNGKGNQRIFTGI